jgi:hypothetical protein
VWPASLGSRRPAVANAPGGGGCGQRSWAAVPHTCGCGGRAARQGGPEGSRSPHMWVWCLILTAPAPGLGLGRMPLGWVGAALTSWRAVHPNV